VRARARARVRACRIPASSRVITRSSLHVKPAEPSGTSTTTTILVPRRWRVLLRLGSVTAQYPGRSAARWSLRLRLVSDPRGAKSE
jgi:hypothetical protein